MPDFFAWPKRTFAVRVFVAALILRGSFLAFWLWKGIGAAYGQDPYRDFALSWLGWTPPIYMDATHPPLYSMFMAAVLWCFRTADPLPVQVLQCFLSGAVCLMFWRIGARLASERVGRLAALWIALDPALIFFTPQTQTETFFIFLEAGLFVALYVCLDAEPDRKGLFLVSGFWGGLAALCRSAFAAYPAFLALALAKMGQFRRRLVFLVLFCVGWSGPILGWTARNYMKFHAFVPMSAQMGWNLYEGFTLDREVVRRHPREMGEEVRRQGITDPLAVGRYFMDKALALMREHPVKAAGIIIGKMFLYWRPWLYDPYTPAQRIVLTAYFSILFAMALFGLWINRASPALWWPIYAALAYFTLTHSIFATFVRYRMPLEPFICLLGAVGLDRLLESRAFRDRSKPS